MSRAIRQRPSFGFLFVLSSYVLLISMLAWGSSQPELDRVWLVLQSMQRDGFSGLSAPDVQNLRKALRQYPGFPRALIGRAPIGWVEPTKEGWIGLRKPHLVIDGYFHGSLPLAVECRAPPLAFPVTVSFDYEGQRQSLRFPENGRQSLNMHLEPQLRPGWVQVSVDPTQVGSDQSLRPEIRIKAQGVPEHEAAP